MARFKAALLPPLRVVEAKYTSEQATEMLLRSVTMEQIHTVAHLLGMTFKEAYQQRAHLFRQRFNV